MNAALWLLTIANLLNYIDRYIIASVAPRIESEFGLTHAQTGMFMSAFMLGYMLTSPLFGWYGDRKNRPRLMSLGIIGWSIATACSGFANSFAPLLLSRIGVGVGEASYATISPSYIRDRLKDNRAVNRAIGFFYTAIPIGAALGYMWGGYMAEHYSWRWAFFLGALPGFFLGALVWRLAEPGRGKADHSPTPFKSALKELWESREYRLTVAGYTVYTFGLGGFAAWAPHYGSSVLGASLAESSFKIGAVTCVAGIVGTLIGGRWGDVFLNKDQSTGASAARGFNKFSAITSLVATPFAFWAIHAQSMNGFMLAMLLVQIALFAASAPINTAVLAAVSPKIASTAFAVQIFVIHALGDVISPPLVGYLADRMPMGDAMNILSAAIGFSAIIWWIAGMNSETKARPQAPTS